MHADCFRNAVAPAKQGRGGKPLLPAKHKTGKLERRTLSEPALALSSRAFCWAPCRFGTFPFSSPLLQCCFFY